MKPAVLLLAALGIATMSCRGGDPGVLRLSWEDTPDRPWAGPGLWANRLQDWEVSGGRLTALSDFPMRTVHILSRRGEPSSGEIRVRAIMGLSANPAGEGGTNTGDAQDGFSGGGFLMGVGDGDLDSRRAALVHHSPGPGGGLFLGVDAQGHLLAADFSGETGILARTESALPSTDSLDLRVEARSVTGDQEGRSAVSASGILVTGRSLGGEGPVLTLELPNVWVHRLAGGMALVSHGSATPSSRAWFSSVEVGGSGIRESQDRNLGPILGVQHLSDHGVLSLTAQLFPISPLMPGPGTPSRDSVRLDLRVGDGGWEETARTPVVVPGYTATFTIEDWPAGDTVPYRITLLGSDDGDPGNAYIGSIRPEPLEKEEFVVAAFTGNHNVASPGVDRGSFDWKNNLWFPHEDIVAHVRVHDPDFLFFSGDQVYEGASPTQADYQHPYLDYLYKWYLWLWAFRDLTAAIPSVAIPDDHDVFHGNVWGAGGRATPPGLTGAEAQDQGGYRLPADWVNMVQRTQASHLPKPRGPSPLDGGIEAYYSDFGYGGISFAVLEDRKFKSPPKLAVPAADIWNGWAQNPSFDPRTEADSPGASLLGADQEAFLEEWANDWTGGIWMKVVLSQTIFQNVATIPAGALNGSVIPSLPIPEPGSWVEGDKLAADMDSNGWPQSGRRRALRSMRKGFAVHLAGDQHLASTIQYGVEDFGDGPFALCVPSIANFWPRRWYPPEPDRDRAPGAPAYAGNHMDGFGNLMTVYAVSNPGRWGRQPSLLHDRAPGYGIARFNRVTREVTLEAWPRWADPESGDPPYPGWPVRFQQEEGYGKTPWGYLPTLVVTGLDNPVVQVVSELGGEVVYTIRMRGSSFTPGVFGPGSYTVKVGEPGTEVMKTLLGLQAMPESGRTLEIDFGEPGEPRDSGQNE